MVETSGSEMEEPKEFEGGVEEYDSLEEDETAVPEREREPGRYNTERAPFTPCYAARFTGPVTQAHPSASSARAVPWGLLLLPGPSPGVSCSFPGRPLGSPAPSRPSLGLHLPAPSRAVPGVSCSFPAVPWVSCSFPGRPLGLLLLPGPSPGVSCSFPGRPLGSPAPPLRMEAHSVIKSHNSRCRPPVGPRPAHCEQSIEPQLQMQTYCRPAHCVQAYTQSSRLVISP
ncbi:unnamed protein product [Gadus morhua 'NCC']